MTTKRTNSIFDTCLAAQYNHSKRFSVIISDGEYVLVEIAASVRPNITERLTRK